MKGEKRKKHFYFYFNNHKDCNSGTLSIGLYCSNSHVWGSFREFVVGRFLQFFGHIPYIRESTENTLREERKKEDEILYPPKRHHWSIVYIYIYIYIRGYFTEDLRTFTRFKIPSKF